MEEETKETALSVATPSWGRGQPNTTRQRTSTPRRPRCHPQVALPQPALIPKGFIKVARQRRHDAVALLGTRAVALLVRELKAMDRGFTPEYEVRTPLTPVRTDDLFLAHSHTHIDVRVDTGCLLFRGR